MPEETRVNVEGGKYTFRVVEGQVFIDRYGDPWMEVKQGGKAILALVCEYEELASKTQEKAAKADESLQEFWPQLESVLADGIMQRFETALKSVQEIEISTRLVLR